MSSSTPMPFLLRLPIGSDPELVYSCPKKSGKTATAAFVVLYVVVVLGGKCAEGYALANDLEQSTGRVFQAIARIVQASPLLRDAAKVTGTRADFVSRRPPRWQDDRKPCVPFVCRLSRTGPISADPASRWRERNHSKSLTQAHWSDLSTTG